MFCIYYPAHLVLTITQAIILVVLLKSIRRKRKAQKLENAQREAFAKI